MRKTIRAAQFMYYVPTGEDQLSVRHAFIGDTVDIPRDEDVERGEAGGAFEPDEVEQESPVAEETDEEGLDFTSHDSLVSWIRDDKPTAAEVIEAADDDPDKASLLLAAEEEATGGQPRRTVAVQLKRIQE